MGRVSRIENRAIVRGALAVWRVFTDLDLSDAADEEFPSLHACFTRRLRPGARPVDPDPARITSPSDGIVGACGAIADGTLLQVKGRAYALAELLGDDAQAAALAGGTYVTLRLTSAMYHRFHAPHDCVLHHVIHIPGGRWNVNPATLRRVARVFCRNERVVICARLADGTPLTLVAVAAVLVGGIRLRFLDLAPAAVPRSLACDATARKGEELGWFEHGSTIIVLAPQGITLFPGITQGDEIRMGQPLLGHPP